MSPACAYIEERVDRNGGVRLEVQRVARVVEGLRHVTEELAVLLGADLVLALEPQRLDRVDALAVDVDRESNKVRVPVSSARDGRGG